MSLHDIRWLYLQHLQHLQQAACPAGSTKSSLNRFCRHMGLPLKHQALICSRTPNHTHASLPHTEFRGKGKGICKEVVFGTWVRRWSWNQIAPHSLQRANRVPRGSSRPQPTIMRMAWTLAFLLGCPCVPEEARLPEARLTVPAYA